jgi:pyridoxamine 5'-phosphate oxidase family protein
MIDRLIAWSADRPTAGLWRSRNHNERRRAARRTPKREARADRGAGNVGRMFTELEVAYLNDQRLGRLATVQRSGQPQASPVGFTWNAALAVFDIPGMRMAATQKFRNLASNNRVALVIDDIVSVDPWAVRCLEIRGTAEALEQPDDVVGPVYGAGAIIRIHPARIISHGIDPDATSPRTVG